MSKGNRGGRPPKPTLLKIVGGTARPDRVLKDEPQPIGDLKVPPAWLTAEQKEIWSYAIEHAPKGLLRLLDRDLFLSWVRAVAERDLCEAKVAELGPVLRQARSVKTTKSPNGTVTTTTRPEGIVRSPWAIARDAAEARMMKAISELGFSPTSRSRITLAAGGKKDANRFSGHAARKA